MLKIGLSSYAKLDLSADNRLYACFDTNHLLGEDPCEFIKRLGKKIITTHVSDYDFINEHHWLPGERKHNWQGIIGALKETDFCGAWLYELDFKAPKK